MNDILYLISYAIGGILLLNGIWRFISFKLLLSRCTEETRGEIVDSVRQRKPLSWPSMDFYYPIFQFDDGHGISRVIASKYAARHENEISKGREYLIRYDPANSARFYAPEWDSPLKTEAISKAVLGLVILGLTVYASLR